MLYNLKRRFQEARIPLHHLFTQDITKKSGLESDNLFDIIICDVPCSGSGTWSRTPEQYKSFKPDSLLAFNDTQRQVVQNALPHLKKDGLLFYITCSVFKDENENIVKDIIARNKLDLLDLNYIKGYEKKADTMFVAVMKHSSKDL
jgi:16S rRNA (cytosine967-C5)-methyltransferase